MVIALVLALLSLVLTSCANDEVDTVQDQEVCVENSTAETETEIHPDDANIMATGQLNFVANGEDFVRQGFVSSDGWEITFTHLYITIANVAAFQSSPPYDPHSCEEIPDERKVELNTTVTLDLAEGDENASPIHLGMLSNIPAGHYNALSWDLIPADSGPSEGYSILIEARASKGNQMYDVTLGIEERYRYQAGEYVGETRKGFVTAEEAGELEMTFHFDHIFGDFDQPADSDLNLMAIGFEPFADLMQEGTVYEDLASLSHNMPGETYEKLIEVLPTLGHTGEGHCYCTLIH